MGKRQPGLGVSEDSNVCQRNGELGSGGITDFHFGCFDFERTFIVALVLVAVGFKPKKS